MTSSLTWVVLDEQHQRDVMTTVALLQEPGTIDELGLGTVRDALSNLLFPGTSVLYTRAKYLLFVPWIYDEVVGSGLRGERAVTEVRRREVRLIDSLLREEQRLQEDDPTVVVPGIIGREARGNLKTMPSSVYWAGLRRLGILSREAVLNNCLRARSREKQGRVRLSRDEDGNLAPDSGAWYDLPDPDDFSRYATFDLNAAQARYLRERIRVTATGTMLDWLLDQDPADLVAGDAPWTHPEVTQLPDGLARQVEMARWFSQLAQGATLLYTLMLAQASPFLTPDDGAAALAAEVADWHQRFLGEAAHTPDDLWRVVRRDRLRPDTVAFIEQWFAYAATSASLATSQPAREWLTRREFRLKGGRARLTNLRLLENWTPPRQVGTMTYRWPMVCTVVGDIGRGLTEPDDALT